MQPQAPTTKAKIRHGWVRHLNLFHDLETNPRTQYHVHIWAQRFWMVNIPVVLYMFLWQPKLWLGWGLLLTTIYSLYANWATDSGAAASASAVMNTTPTTAQLEQDIKKLAGGKYDI